VEKHHGSKATATVNSDLKSHHLIISSPDAWAGHQLLCLPLLLLWLPACLLLLVGEDTKKHQASYDISITASLCSFLILRIPTLVLMIIESLIHALYSWLLKGITTSSEEGLLQESIFVASSSVR
jgi:hypothetical protein